MTTGTPALLLLLLAASPLAHAGPLSRSPCELLPVGESHPAQALQRSFSALAGCASRSTATLPQEVHVINLRRSDITAASGPDHAPLEVTLHLGPLQSLLVHSKPLVFVLSSPQPLVWRVQTEKLALGLRHTFQVSPDSEVRFQSGNFSAATQVLREILPDDNGRLLSWALKKYGGLTSFLELRMTQDIHLKVGEDRLFPESCQIVSGFLSLNYLGAYTEPRTSSGCVLWGPDQDPEVHIIELESPQAGRAFQVDVLVELRPLGGRGPLRRDVVLILKCSKPVNWVVSSRDVSGRLEVLSSDTIALAPGTESLMQVSKLPKLPLPSGSQALIKWAEQRGHRPLSFTATAVANLFKLRLREPEVVDHMDSVFPPELAIFRDPEEAGEAGEADRRPALPFLPLPFLPGWGEGEPQEQQGVLSAGLEVRCEESRMVVSVDRESLQASGFSNANLTLQDPECKAKVNATHYTLETPLSGCQTQVFSMPGSSTVLHINSVLISAGLRDSEDQDRDSEDLGVPHMDRTSLEPTDLPFITFNCSYEGEREASPPAPGAVPGPGDGGDPGAGAMALVMEVYDSVLFRSANPQPVPSFSSGQQVFVEVLSSGADWDQGFMIQSCSVSPDPNPRGPLENRLLENLCPTDDSLRFFPPMVGRQRFSFRLDPPTNASLLFLHCNISPCSKGPRPRPQLPTCIPAKQGCTAVNLDTIFSMAKNSHTASQALVVTSEGGRPRDPTGLPDVPDNGKTETVKYVLDTPTMVCIAFAAFVIGALLTGALWFIYSNTGGGKGAPKPVVQKSPPASENSSAAHSIDSTQSTPCSSSSTA